MTHENTNILISSNKMEFNVSFFLPGTTLLLRPTPGLCQLQQDLLEDLKSLEFKFEFKDL